MQEVYRYTYSYLHDIFKRNFIFALFEHKFYLLIISTFIIASIIVV